MKYTVFNILSKEIVRCGVCDENVFSLQAESGQSVIEGEYSSLTAYVSDGVAILYTPDQVNLKANPPNIFCYWSNETFNWIDSRTENQKFSDAENAVVLKRNALLYESDWTQIPNNPLTPEVQQNWAVYRQQLRDIPQQSGYPFNVVWPTAPAT